MPLNTNEIRKELIESILTQAVELEKRFQSWPLDVQRQYQEKHERARREWLHKLMPHGIDATTIVEAIDKYGEVQRSWTEQDMLNRSELEAKFYRYLVAEEKAEIDAFLTYENLTGAPESEYTTHQRAEVRRIQNRYAHLKTKGVSIEP